MIDLHIEEAVLVGSSPPVLIRVEKDGVAHESVPRAELAEIPSEVDAACPEG